MMPFGFCHELEQFPAIPKARVHLLDEFWSIGHRYAHWLAKSPPMIEQCLHMIIFVLDIFKGECAVRMIHRIHLLILPMLPA
jgi:hypothetical protein